MQIHSRRSFLGASALALIRILFALPFTTGLVAQDQPAWSEPFSPHRVMGNIYFVGTRGLASYLVTTPQGHILINSNLDNTVPMDQDERRETRLQI